MATNTKLGSEIVIYQPDNKKSQVQVRLSGETVWLTQNQLIELFETTKQNVSLHIKNIFKEGELKPSATVKEYLTVQMEGKRQITRSVDHYNLDVIISVGYRVKSHRGTQFRIWANQVLKQHLVKGYTENKRRLQELGKTLELATAIVKRKLPAGDEALALFETIAEYAHALDILDDYDHQRVTVIKATKKSAAGISYEEALQVVEQMRSKFGSSSLFGKEKDSSLKSSLGTIMQSFDGVDLYPSIEEKAAMLLYLLVKNHSFVDGNKRIAAALFIGFLKKNNLLLNKDKTQRIQNNALVAMTLMIAESNPKEKDVMVKMVANLIGSGK